MEMWLWRRMKRTYKLDGKKELTIVFNMNLALSASYLDTFANVSFHTSDTFAEIMAASLLHCTRRVLGRKAKTQEATETVQGQHQAVDKITTWQCVRATEDRSRWKELISQAMVAKDQT